MTNVKYLGFVGLGCALLLTGCGGREKPDVSCSMLSGDGSLNVNVYLSDGKISSMDFEYEYYSQDTTDRDCPDIKNYFKGKADVSCRSRKIYVENYKEDNILRLSKEEFVEYAEDAGYKCE